MKILSFEAGLGKKSLLATYFRQRLAIVEELNDPDEMASLLGRFEFDAVIVHLAEDRLNDVEVIRQLRAISELPIITVSRYLSELARLHVLQAGTDDLIIAPLSHEEVFMKVQNLIRRTHGVLKSSMRIGGAVLDLNNKKIHVNGEPLRITRKEYQIIEMLALRQGIMTKDAILDHLYPSHEEKSAKIVDVFICKIRRKLRDVGIPEFIVTHWGMGYSINVQVPALPLERAKHAHQTAAPALRAFA